MDSLNIVRMGGVGYVTIALLLMPCLASCFVDAVGEGIFGDGGSGGGGGDTVSTGGTGGVGGSLVSTGGVGGESSTGGSGGGEECADGLADCDMDSSNGCEVDLLNDVETCGGCMSLCGSLTDAVCNDGICEGPCGPVPSTGLHVCWVYGSFPVMPTQFVGLAGGSADKSIGEGIEEKFLDPWCVNPNIGEPFVLCDLGESGPTFDIQFRAGLHLAPDQGTIAGTWDCSTDSCGGSVYVYEDGIEIGTLISDVETGVVSTIPHFNPPGLLNVQTLVP